MLGSLRRRRRATRPAAVAAAAGAASAAVVAAGAAVARRRATTPVMPPPAPALDPPDPAGSALDALAAQPDLPHGVAEAYRAARRAYHQASEDGGHERLHRQATVLWWSATFAEPHAAKEARRVARATRELLALLEERRDLLALSAAAGERSRVLGTAAEDAAAHAAARTRKLEKRIRATGRELFATKPAKVAARIADP